MSNCPLIPSPANAGAPGGRRVKPGDDEFRLISYIYVMRGLDPGSRHESRSARLAIAIRPSGISVGNRNRNAVRTPQFERTKQTKLQHGHTAPPTGHPPNAIPRSTTTLSIAAVVLTL